MLFHRAVIAAAAPTLLGAGAAAAAVDWKKKDAAPSSTNAVDAASVTAAVAESTIGKKKLFQPLSRARRLAPKDDPGRLSSSSAPDVGVLFRTHGERSLAETTTEYFCPRDKCPAELCDCAEAGGDMAVCHTELLNVCQSGKIADCIYETYTQMYEELYCPFVSCLAADDSNSAPKCDCDFYNTYCARLKGEECLDGDVGAADITASPGGAEAGEKDKTDKSPFFGCDETRLDQVCEYAEACVKELKDDAKQSSNPQGEVPKGAVGDRVIVPPSSTARAFSSAMGNLVPVLLAAACLMRSALV